MAITKPTAITKPFSVNGDYVLPPTSPDSFQANQDTGFPPSQSVILPAGTPVKRDELNGVFKLYSQFILWLTAGGQSTFEQSISDANSGYPKETVLWCKSINGYLVSLIDNNTANFVTTPSYINDNINWKTVNGVQSDFNRIKNLGSATTYTLALTDAFSLICNNGVSIAYSLPAYTTFPVGTTFCIKNQTGAINNGIYSIAMTAGQSNDYYKCEVGNNGWIVDGQPIATYSQWATKSYVSSYVSSAFSQSFADSGWTKLPNGFIMQWSYLTVAPSSATAFNFPIAFPNAGLNIQITSADITVNASNYRWAAAINSRTQFTIYNGWNVGVIPYFVFAIGY